MCGLCGLCGLHSRAPRGDLAARVRRMTGMLSHRGPDAEGVFVSDFIAFGHRRLSIIDLSETGAQPMSLGGVTVSYNGEIYNFQSLRNELRSLGRVFRGTSDTEVILHAYDVWGLDGLQRLEGLFAIALWDGRRGRLVLMRDRFGIKPLFYAEVDHTLIFASEIKALLAVGGVDRTLDDQAFAEYLWYGNAYEDRTIYRSIKALPPGNWLIAEGGATRIECWWRIEDWMHAPLLVRNFSDATVLVRERVDAAVRRQLVADVPVGIFLSGGIDSSSIAAAAMTVQDTALSSYSVGFDFDGGINELAKARLVAEHLQLDHHEIHVRGADLPDVLLKLVKAFDEPFADAANIPLYLLAAKLDGAVKVVLQGDGGDEMFAGYRRYSLLSRLRWEKLWPRVLTPLLASASNFGRRAARMVEALGSADAGERMALLLTVETLANSPVDLLQPEARKHLSANTDPFVAYRNCATRFQAHEPVRKMLLTDISLQLPSQFLTKVDRATMALGLEARVPLLDELVAQVATAMPVSWLVAGGKNKVVLREAFRRRLPDSILDGPKTGFGVPYEHWLRTSLYGLARDMILSDSFLAKFGFNRVAVSRALEDHRSGNRDRGFTLWKLLQLALWSQYSA